MEIAVTNTYALIEALSEAQNNLEEPYIIHLTGSDKDYGIGHPVEKHTLIGLPVIYGDVTINGNQLTLTRTESIYKSHLYGFRFFTIDGKSRLSQAKLTLNQLMLFNGRGSKGGAIVNDGTLILNGCVLYSNFGDNGGALYNDDGSRAIINDCAFIKNAAYESGSAIYNCDGGWLQISNSIFFENIAPNLSEPIFQHENGHTAFNSCAYWNGEAFRDIQESNQLIKPDELMAFQLLNSTLYRETKFRKIRHEAPAQAENLLKVYQHRWFAPSEWVEKFIEVDNHTFLEDLATYVNREEWRLTTLQKSTKQLQKDIIRRLAFAPRQQNLNTLLKINLEHRTYYYRKDQDELAILIVSGQETETVLQLFVSPVEEKLFEILGREPELGRYMTDFISILYRLQQELVMRGIKCDSLPFMRQFWEKYKDQQPIHGVGLLPLKLHDIERDIHYVLSTYQLDPAKSTSGVNDDFFLGAGGPVLEFWSLESQAIKLRKRTSTKFRTLASQAVENWKFEVALFIADEPIKDENITDEFLLNLNLWCLKGTHTLADVQLYSTEPSEVFSLLFAAASTDETVSKGHGHIQGRLRAWHSLSALVGGNAQTEFEEIETLATKCSWRLFWAESDWFYESRYPLGIICLRPDGMSLAVLAAVGYD